MLALSFNYLDVVILGKAALSIMVRLPSKQSLLPPYLCELIKISSSNCSLPLFWISSPSQLTSLSLFSILLSTLTPALSPLWNNKLFPLSFPLTEDVFGPIPKNLWHETILMPLCVSIGRIAKGVSPAQSPGPSHQLRSGSVNHVHPCPTFQESQDCGNRAGESCSLWQQAHVFISLSKSLYVVWKIQTSFVSVSEKVIRWREAMLSQQYLPSWDMFLNLQNKRIIQSLFILQRAIQKEVCFTVAPKLEKNVLNKKIYLILHVFHFKIKK